MAFMNQGSRPNYPSTQDEIKFQRPQYDSSNHTIWVGGAVRSLSKIDESVDFDWPRKFVRANLACCVGTTDTPVQVSDLSKQDKENLISNIAGHLGGAKSDEIKNRQLCVFEKVSQEFASAVAKAMNYTYTPCNSSGY